MYFILSLALAFNTFAATGATGCELFIDDNYCARSGLSAIYSAEKSYQAEKGMFSDSFTEIGYSQDRQNGNCPSWSESVRVFNGGKEFLATFSKGSTGESWTINEKKELVQERKGSDGDGGR